MPQIDEIQLIVRREAEAYLARHSGQKVRTNQELLGLLVSHLRGLTAADVQRLAHQAVFNDGVIDQSDIDRVVEAKRRLLETASAIRFDFDGVELSELAGLSKLKHWLELRRSVFLGSETGLDRPKGLLLVGVQGGGKSFAAKAIAGSWGFHYSILTWARFTISFLVKRRRTFVRLYGPRRSWPHVFSGSMRSKKLFLKMTTKMVRLNGFWGLYYLDGVK